MTLRYHFFTVLNLRIAKFAVQHSLSQFGLMLLTFEPQILICHLSTTSFFFFIHYIIFPYSLVKINKKGYVH